jgi:flavin reductase (DIM6/NTAB) family NADH-FMN oxidoreductase RutF
MQIDPKQQSKKDNYKLLIGTILPRPIAFVTSLTGEGVVNAAPFSFFNAVATDPLMVSISCARKASGEMKDTARNIMESKEFVVHVVDSTNVEMVNDTAVEFPPDVSEVEEVGFRLTPSVVVKVPRIMESKVHMECILHQILTFGGTTEAPNVDFIIGEVVQFHIADELYGSGRINTELLDPVGRLAGTTYCKVGETFSMSRPSYEDWVVRDLIR